VSLLAALAGGLFQFHIAAGDPDALLKWSIQGDAPFSADSAAVQLHLHATKAVNGEYTPYGALCELLEGTGLSFRYGLAGESEADKRYYISVENPKYIRPYDEVCPTFTEVTPAPIEPPRADWR
jgi:hypothetical protein